jgi:hypothetical protein
MDILLRLAGGVAVCVGIAAAFYYLMTHLIPAGAPAAANAAAAIVYDPNDLTPRDPVLPPGPHQDAFAFNCIACHSTRLVLTQPKFPEKKWAEIVQKMRVTYGAQTTPPLEAQIVQYLAAVKGTP